ncbi:MAG: hypothetical protein M3Z28_13990 [Candidatus Dormibacteraeota bacterium]|nr:hypothetical protein [Candidatus Dormibacteraeota bacterium]
MCAAVGAVAPAQPAWIPPKEASAPQELSSSAASWAAAAGAARPASRTDLEKAEKHVRSAWRWLATVGAFYVLLGLVTELNYMRDPGSLFGIWAVVVGACFVLLSYFVRQGSFVALAIAIGVYALYTIGFFMAGYFAIFRVVILILLLRWLMSAYIVRQHRASAARQAAAQPGNAAPPEQHRAA